MVGVGRGVGLGRESDGGGTRGQHILTALSVVVAISPKAMAARLVEALRAEVGEQLSKFAACDAQSCDCWVGQSRRVVLRGYNCMDHVILHPVLSLISVIRKLFFVVGATMFWCYHCTCMQRLKS